MFGITEGLVFSLAASCLSQVTCRMMDGFRGWRSSYFALHSLDMFADDCVTWWFVQELKNSSNLFHHSPVFVLRASLLLLLLMLLNKTLTEVEFAGCRGSIGRN